MNGAAKWIMILLAFLTVLGSTAWAINNAIDSNTRGIAVNTTRIEGLKESIAELKAEQRRGFREIKRLLEPR